MWALDGDLLDTTTAQSHPFHGGDDGIAPTTAVDALDGHLLDTTTAQSHPFHGGDDGIASTMAVEALDNVLKRAIGADRGQKTSFAE